MRFGFGMALCLLTASCVSNHTMMTRYHEDGRAKPVVAIAPIIDTTSFDVPWSLSEELTSMVVKQIIEGNLVFAEPQEDYAFAENPFGGDLSWVKREFPSHEFVVFSELVEHTTVPANKAKENLSPQEISMNLNTAVRIRVIDLRTDTPQIVLQELVRNSYYLPKTLLPTNYQEVTWGSSDYRASPMGIAHAELVQDIGERVKTYILLAKSR